MDAADPRLSEYDRAAPDLARAAAALHEAVARLLALRPEIKVHSITMRQKSRGSLAGKLALPDRSYPELWDVTDLVGLRVITYFEDGVDRVAEVLEGALPLALEDSVDKRGRGDPGAFGYRSLHYVCRLADLPGAPPGLAANARGEVQVRTVLEHAWAEIEHDLGYKARDVVPAPVRRRLSRLAGLLELADQEFLAIRTSLEDYAAALPARIAAEGESVAVDRVSLGPLLACEEVLEVDREVAVRLGLDLGDEPFFPEYLARMLLAAGVDTVGAARRGVAARRDAIAAMVLPYFSFTSRAWHLAPERMGRVYRGYSLFFLAHAELLASSALRIDKVARLARLYRELDYPDDERAAQRVASALVDAFSAAAAPPSAPPSG